MADAIRQRARWGTQRAQFSVRILQDILDQVDERARARGWNRSKWIAAALIRALDLPEGREFVEEPEDG